MKLKKLFQVLIPVFLIAFLLFYIYALRDSSAKLMGKYIKNKALLEKAEFDLRKCKNDSAAVVDVSTVPTEKVACQVAEVILTPIYGEDNIKKQMPFKATLVSDSVWVVEGVQKEIAPGGVAYIEIQKRDCKILKVTHGE